MTVAIEAGKAAHLDTVEGKTLEFKCLGGAHAMSVEASKSAHILAAPRIKCLSPGARFRSRKGNRVSCGQFSLFGQRRDAPAATVPTAIHAFDMPSIDVMH